MEVLGETLDDAVGEAFDKSAKIFGLDYPGGPLIDKRSRNGDEDAFEFAKPVVDGLNFSFSGLKTSVLYFIQKQLKSNPHFVQENLNDLCASLQRTVVSILMEKIGYAVASTGIKRVAIAGGVSANSKLREELLRRQTENNWKVYIPKLEYTTDNAAMVGITGYFKYLQKDFCSYSMVPKAKYYL
ncbi:tRNA N6-adenosine threonylcarbamoyltransferase [Elysia marginata]|uniref:N(6)-L-threonylcarbamoyladenine synthase n=1 Tax=Elysia marginata TaxID=1093978 RepID=A0AAV4FXS3_9GAST|nr:tRNA N6-adenosine threonylcarbamoyltransferase [Elysia marginata]